MKKEKLREFKWKRKYENSYERGLNRLIDKEFYSKHSQEIEKITNFVIKYGEEDETNEAVRRLLSSYLTLIDKGFYNFTSKVPIWYKKYIENHTNHIPHEDHIQYTKNGEIIIESYILGMNNMKEIIEFCERNNWDFTIEGRTFHYPNVTFRITIKPKEEKTIL